LNALFNIHSICSNSDKEPLSKLLYALKTHWRYDCPMITSISLLLALFFARRKLRAKAAAARAEANDKAPQLPA
jgi:hypothetical protein